MKSQEITIWTANYNPWVMGGNVHAPIATKHTVHGDPIDAGKGIKVWVIVSPAGTTHVAESETGAFVGKDIDEVRNDIAEGDEAVMAQQLIDAKQALRRAKHLTPEDFWSRFK